jgi:hypothetical protein
MQEQITEDWAEARLSEWEETMADADNELNSARSSKNRDAIKEAQEVWHWTKEQLEMAAARVVLRHRRCLRRNKRATGIQVGSSFACFEVSDR